MSRTALSTSMTEPQLDVQGKTLALSKNSVKTSPSFSAFMIYPLAGYAYSNRAMFR